MLVTQHAVTSHAGPVALVEACRSLLGLKHACSLRAFEHVLACGLKACEHVCMWPEGL